MTMKVNYELMVIYSNIALSVYDSAEIFKKTVNTGSGHPFRIT